MFHLLHAAPPTRAAPWSSVRLTQSGAPRQHTHPQSQEQKQAQIAMVHLTQNDAPHKKTHTHNTKKQKEAKIKDKDRSHKTRCKLQMGGISKIANEEECSDCCRRSTRTNRRTMDG
jgi:hypothetical protein